MKIESETIVFCDTQEEDLELFKKQPYLHFRGLLGICSKNKAIIFVDRIIKSKIVKKHGIIKTISGILFHELLHICAWEASEYEVNRMEEIVYEY